MDTLYLPVSDGRSFEVLSAAGLWQRLAGAAATALGLWLIVAWLLGSV